MESKYLYDRFEFTEKYKNEIIEMLRHNTNVEIGGHRNFDGQRTHLVQSPWELADFIFELKNLNVLIYISPGKKNVVGKDIKYENIKSKTIFNDTGKKFCLKLMKLIGIL